MKRIVWVMAALLAVLMGSGGWISHAAAPLRPVTPALSAYDLLLSRMANRPLRGAGLPAVDTRRILPEDAQRFGMSPEQLKPRLIRGSSPAPRAVSPPPAPPPWVDLTTFPRPPLVGPSTLSRDLHPNYAPDQQSIWFDSDRTDINGAQLPPLGSGFHVYQMAPDGSTVVKITGTVFADEVNGDQLFPTVNPARTKLAYISRPNPNTSFQLFMLDLGTGVRTKMTGVQGQPIGQNFINVGRPSWSRGGSFLAVAAQRVNVAGDPLNIYTVDVISRAVFNVTQIAPNAAGMDAVDAAWLPFTDEISFSSTCKAIVGGTGALNPASATPGFHDIWKGSPLGPAPARPFTRLTTQASTDNREPAWNRGTTSRFSGDLAFSSFGRAPIAQTWNVFWIPDTQLPESAGVARTLQTPNTDPLVAAVNPALVNVTDQTSPSWSLGFNRVERIVHHANRLADLQPSFTPNYPLPWDVGRGGNRDIWNADVQDTNPPTLLPIDEQQGVIVDIKDDEGRQLGVAGSKFTFKARLMDLGSGVNSVFAQIKDPDSATQDAAGLEHKLFGRNTDAARWNGTRVTHALSHSDEYDAEGISASDYSYYRGLYIPPSTPALAALFFPPIIPTPPPGGTPPALLPNERLDYVGQNPLAPNSPAIGNALLFGGSATDGIIKVMVPSYLPGIDDAVAFTGSIYPPPAGNRWLQLKDDGIAPDQVAADGIFTAEWITPSNASDFYVDLIAYDNAQDPINASLSKNWIIYDNIAGFSTQPFQSQFQALAVMDYALGQKWLRAGTLAPPNPPTSRGNFRPFPAFRRGTEAEVLNRPTSTYPQGFTLPDPASMNPVIGPYNISAPTWSTGAVTDFVGGPAAITSLPAFATIAVSNGAPAPPGSSTAYPQYNYDLWRVLSKGPVPLQVLQDYVPLKEAQPLDILGNSFIQRQVPTRFVLWHAPYTGDLWAGAGTILDVNTHNKINNFLSLGGRIIVDGADIGWALTQDGADPNQPFLKNTLDANFLGDSIGIMRDAFSGGALPDEITHDVFNGQFRNGGSPPYPYPVPVHDPIETALPFTYPLVIGAGAGDSGVLDDACPSSGDLNNGIIDGITAGPKSFQIYNNVMIGRQETVSQDTVAKLIYCSFGLHTMGRQFNAMADDQPLLVVNWKAMFGHASACWFMSASLTGQVKDITDKAVSGAWVRLSQGGQIVGSAFTGGDGFYIVRGLPHGGWSIRVDSPGFQSFQKADGGSAHSIMQPRTDVRLTAAAPGTIAGQVVDVCSPPKGVPGVVIKATLQASPLFTGQRDFFATTDLNGNYQIDNASTGTYDVKVDTIPANFQNPQPSTQVVVVNSSQTTANVNFTLDGKPAPLDVFVFQQNPDGTQGPPLAGAQVVLLQNGVPLPGFQGITDAAGKVGFVNVPTCDLVAEVTKDGFRQTQVPFHMPQQSPTLTILVQTDNRPRGNVFGMVRSQRTGQPLPVPRFGNLQVKLQEPGGQFNRTTNLTAVDPVPAPHNFLFQTIPDDTYDLNIDDNRFQPVTRRVATLAPNTDLGNIDLVGNSGVLQGEVRELLPGGGIGDPIPNATVKIATMAAPNTILFTLTTNSQGRYSTGVAIASDLYKITATAFAFLPGGVDDVFVAGNTTAPPVLLQRAPNVQVSGTIRSAVAPNPLIAGALVQLIRLSDGVILQETTSEAVETGSPSHNYIFPSVPVGDNYIVKVIRSGYVGQQRAITVNPGVPVNRVDFFLNPAFVYQPGLVLTSPPDDYPNMDAAAVFGNPPGFRSAIFLPEQNRYAIYPEPPANQVRVGRGQFVRLTTTVSFTTPGIKTPPGPFLLSVKEGWQLIGSGRDVRVSFLTIRVIQADGSELSMQEALDRNIILNNLVGWSGAGYINGEAFLEPFRAYYLKAFQAVTLKIPDPTQTALPEDGQKYAATPVWDLGRIAAEIAAAGLAPPIEDLTLTPCLPRIQAAGSSLGRFPVLLPAEWLVGLGGPGSAVGSASLARPAPGRCVGVGPGPQPARWPEQWGEVPWLGQTRASRWRI